MLSAVLVVAAREVGRDFVLANGPGVGYLWRETVDAVSGRRGCRARHGTGAGRPGSFRARLTSCQSIR